MGEYADIWDALEHAPSYATATSDLYHWSTNYAPGEGPITLFLDIIGWSDDELGERIYRGAFPVGYVEAGKLAAALTEWADRPHDVREYVDQLLILEAVG